jgi:hypothetical protein
MNTPRQSDWQVFFLEFAKSPRRVPPESRTSRLTDDMLAAAHLSEATADGLGELGLALLAEIDSYLEFFAIAEAGDEQSEWQSVDE